MSNRRTFLQQISSVFVSLGISETAISVLSDRYSRALADTTNRKLALLVGINKYPDVIALNGCINDVQLQEELLIYRYGFKPQYLLTLTDEKATQENIINAVNEHLIKQVTTNDLVFIHFSGYGCEKGLVTSDNNKDNQHIFLEDLTRSLPTKNLITILDTSYIITPSKLKIRSHPQSQLNVNNSINVTQKSGILLTAAKVNQTAVEINFNGMTTGLFTSALTQQMWQITNPKTIYFNLAQAVTNVTAIMGDQQIPQISIDRINQSINLGDNLPTDGVILSVDDNNKVTLSLHGMSPIIWQNSEVNFILNCVKDNNQMALKTTNIQGVKAQAKIMNIADKINLNKGDFLREKLRIIPKNIGLTIAIDSSLDRIEKVEATSALDEIDYITNVVKLGEQPADYIFGKIPNTNSYALLGLNNQIICKNHGETGEAIQIAIQKLKPKLAELLAIKLCRIINNYETSQLAVKSTLELLSSPSKILTSQQTNSAKILNQPVILPSNIAPIPTLVNNNKIQTTIENYTPEELYYILIGFNPDGTAIATFPTSTKTAITNLGEWSISPTLGIGEMHIIGSINPLDTTSAQLTSIWGDKNKKIGQISEPLTIIKALLADLHQSNSYPLPDNSNIIAENYILDVENWASLNIIYQVV
jgi:Caspase domain